MRDYNVRIIPDRSENEENLCRYCHLSKLDENIPTIYNITSLEDLQDFLTNNQYSKLNEYHPHGYTFVHKLFWNFGRERFAHRNFSVAHESQKMIFYLLENYSQEFKQSCGLGLSSDAGNTPLHDYIMNISFIKKDDVFFIEYLNQFDLDYSIKDTNGYTFLDYVKFKTLPYSIKNIIQNKQYILKGIEKKVIASLMDHYKEKFHNCEKCKKIINLYRDIDSIESVDQALLKEIQEIIDYRQELNDIYKKNSFNDPKTLESHELVVEIWKRKLFLGSPTV